jgi:hypothetical protein
MKMMGSYKVKDRATSQVEVALEEETIAKLFEHEVIHILRDHTVNRVILPFRSLNRLLQNNVHTWEYILAVLKDAPNCWKNDWRKTRHKHPHLSFKTKLGTKHEVLEALTEARRCFERWETKRVIKMRKVTNLMSGQIVEEPEDTPRHCSVGSETYWSS